MSAYAPIKIQYNPQTTYPGTTQTGFVGAQTVAGQRGTLPSFNDGNSYSVAKTGSDSNAGTQAAPFLTLGKAFAPGAAGLLTDYSASPLDLVQHGTAQQRQWPCFPMPPSGDFQAGPFANNTDYFTMQAGSAGVNGYRGLQGSTAFCIEGYIYFESFLNTNSTVWQFNDGGANNFFFIENNGSLHFQLNGVDVTGTGPGIGAGRAVLNTQYYFSCVLDSVGSKLYFGESPETAVLCGQNTTPRTIGTMASFTIGRSASGSDWVDGYLSRLFVSKIDRTAFPTHLYSSGTTVTTNLVGAFYFQTLPLMVTAPKDYVAVNDSGNYNEGLRFNFPYESPTSLGIYAKDGFAPTFQAIRGAIGGTFGAGNAARIAPTVTTASACFVAKTGNDGTGTRGNPALPFLTNQAALNATTTDGDQVVIQDSGTYIETLTLPALELTLMSAAGQAPILKPGPVGTAQIVTTSTKVFSLSGVFMVGNATGVGSQLFDETGAQTLFASDCSFQTYNNLKNGIGIPASLDFTNCTLGAIPTLDANGTAAAQTLSMVNCSLQAPTAFNSSAKGLMQGCTISGAMTSQLGRINSSLRLKQCLFLNGSLSTTSISTGPDAAFGICDSDFKSVISSSHITHDSGSYKTRMLIYNCAFETTTSAAYAVKGETLSSLGVYHSSAINYDRGFYIIGTQAQTGSCIHHCSTAKCVVAGFDADTDVIGNALADSGSATAFVTFTPTQSVSNAIYLSTSGSSENLTLASTSPGVFLADNGVTKSDAGIGAALFDLEFANVTINGLTFAGDANRNGGVVSSNSQPFVLEFCSFYGLGTFGVFLPALSDVSNCLFNVNGNGIKIGQYTNSLTNNAGYACGGAFIQNFGQVLTSTSNTSSSCGYGEYDAPQATATITNCIFSESGTYDYSGQNAPTYSDIGTLDPSGAINSTADLGIGCIRNDPLLANPSTGDLTLQAIARGYFWDSPCIGTGSGGSDMGAYTFTYGTAVTAWTTIDFATNGYFNPDQVLRREIPVKLAEGDMESGAIYSVSATYKKEYEFTWNPVANPMSLAQTAALLDMFLTSTNQIQIDFGDGRRYVAAFLARQSGFEYADMTGFYSNDAVPLPVRQIVIREA